MRIGHGYDVHRLVEGRKLILGGVEIPFEKGLLGHSDADVLAHAVMDAVLGAAALGDIGQHFPDNDPAYALSLIHILVSLVSDQIRKQEKNTSMLVGVLSQIVEFRNGEKMCIRDRCPC